MLEASERPLIVAGGGIINADASDLLVELAEILNVPVVPTLMGWGSIPDDHGLAAGMVASLWLTGFLSTQLYGVAPHDAFTFIAVPVLLLAVGALACMLPAWRAATVDPVRILRGA